MGNNGQTTPNANESISEEDLALKLNLVELALSHINEKNFSEEDQKKFSDLKSILKNLGQHESSDSENEIVTEENVKLLIGAKDLLKPYIFFNTVRYALVEITKSIGDISLYFVKTGKDVVVNSFRSAAHEMADLVELSDSLELYIAKPPKMMTSTIVSGLGQSVGGVAGAVIGATLDPVAGGLIGAVAGSAAGNIAGAVLGTAISTAIRAATAAPAAAIKSARKKKESFVKKITKIYNESPERNL
ncbi:MAG TPA: hypothetical protein QKA08_01280 [Candidatus Megaira endosymbiont of Nemacystus decipiens]|nr:hypothetical protein [Candidatus Megaera endosymbiont of Nemacystus decipiens]